MNDEPRNCDEEMTNADLEMQQMGMEALDRCYRNGADPEDLKTVAWIAGLEWAPRSDQQPRRTA